MLAWGNLGEWQFINEIPRGMTSWVIGGNAIDGTPLQSDHFHLTGDNRNAGTDLPDGSSISYITENHCRVTDSGSTLKLKTHVHGYGRRIDFIADIDWREIGDNSRGIPGLLINFPFRLKNVVAFCETPFGCVKRVSEADWTEMPSLRFVSVQGTTIDSDIPVAITLLQDSKYGFVFNEGELKMRVVRSSFDPDHAPEVAKQSLRYALVFHESIPTTAELTRLGTEFNHPLIVLPTNLQSGHQNAHASLATVDHHDVVLSAIRQGEDGAYVLRLTNYSAEKVRAEVLLSKEWRSRITSAEKVDLLEQSVSSTMLTEKGVVIEIPAYQVASVKLR
jgi:alpha-mannosidase